MDPYKMPENYYIEGTKYVANFEFSSKNEVPIYEVLSCHGLNQIIGYIKLKNKEYGNVYYRGQCKLHKTMNPSLYHDIVTEKQKSNTNRRLNEMVTKVMSDEKFMKFSSLDKEGLEKKRFGLL